MPDLVERWPAAVGDAIARHAWPARISRDGTLHVHTADSVWAFELAQRAAEIAERVEVARVKFAPGPLPEPAPKAVRPAPAPTADDVSLAARLAAPIASENLRETVQKAISLALVRARFTR